MEEITNAHIFGVFEMTARSEDAHRDAVIRACEAIGYGRVMQIASDAWREKDPVGALTLGPCAGARRKA